jgi:S-adenosyl-L-methionine hydrolase (adenosine-forming)
VNLPIVFASDFGPGTEWVGVCHAVMAGVAPECRIIDISHALPRFDVGGAGLVLREAMPFAPLCIGALIVDPGVGTDRRPIAVKTGRGDVLVGPDNGLLPLAAERIGGIASAKLLDVTAFLRANASMTFQARDLFCPIAAQMSAGLAYNDVGDDLQEQILVRAVPPLLEVGNGRIVAEAIDIDRFGNVRIAARLESLTDSGLDKEDAVWVLAPNGEMSAHRAVTFGALDPGRVGLIVDSFGWLSLCINKGNAAERIGAKRGSRIELRSRA